MLGSREEIYSYHLLSSGVKFWSGGSSVLATQSLRKRESRPGDYGRTHSVCAIRSIGRAMRGQDSSPEFPSGVMIEGITYLRILF
jgi:hypothetical protein